MSNVTKEMELKVVDLYCNQLLSINKITKEVKLSNRKINKILKDNNIKQRWKIVPNQGKCPDVNTFIYMCNNNTQSEICNYFNINSNNVIQRWKSECGWKQPNKLITREKLIELYYDKEITVNEISSMYFVTNTTIRDWLKMKTKQERYGDPFYLGLNNRSKPELEIEQFLNSYNLDFSHTRRILKSNKELDGYSYKVNKAFEFCGLYWHREDKIILRKNCSSLGKTYHYNKYKDCIEQGIELITIFEDEWFTKQDKMKNFLKAKCGIFDKRIYARKCKIEYVDKQMAGNFFELNHIQGKPVQVLKTVGLFYEDELVGCMSFGLHHRNNSDIVLNRLSFKASIQVIGGSNKMLNYYLKTNPEVKKIITWSDNRYTSGHLYGNLGFKLDEELPPDYSYTKNNIRKSKQSMKKSNIGCPKEITEKDFCASLGWYRIYDCGKKRWIYER